VFEVDKKLDGRWRAFDTDCFVEVLRNNSQYHIPWTREYLGFHRTPRHQLTEAGNEIFTSYGRSLEDLINRRSIAYQTETGSVQTNIQTYQGFTHKFGPGDDVMKSYVRQNIGPDANDLQRFRPGKMDGFLVMGDTSQAPVWEGDRSFKNLRETVMEIGDATGVDFDVQLVTFDPPTFIFTTYYPQLGTDRSQTNPPVVLSPDNQNVKTIDYTVSRTDEVTTAIVLGQVIDFGPSQNPNTPGKLVTHRSNYSAHSIEADASPWNDIELIRDARSASSQIALRNEVDNVFATLGPHESFVVTPLANANFQYGRDYFFGDRVIVKLGDVMRIKKVVGVTIGSGGDQEGEALSIELGDVAATPTVMDIFRNINNRISLLEHKGDL
jgi:hypothetical protein